MHLFCDKGITQPNNIPEDDHEMTDVSDDDKNTSNIRPSSNNSSHNDKPSLSTSGSGRSTSAGNAMEIDEVRMNQPKKYNNYVLCRIIMYNSFLNLGPRMPHPNTDL